MRNKFTYINPTQPPETALVAPEGSADFMPLGTNVCGGVTYSFWDSIKYSIIKKPTSAELAYVPEEIIPFGFGTPTGVATFLESDIEAADKNMRWQSQGRHLHNFLEWLAWTLGATCGVGLAYTDSNPHIRLYTLPPSKMRGAIGWMYGPPLGRNRTMQLSTAITVDYYFLRLLQHEFGHFLGHYGSGSHSNRREDIMYPTLQHVKAVFPNWGKSDRDIAWEREEFGQPWITE